MRIAAESTVKTVSAGMQTKETEICSMLFLPYGTGESASLAKSVSTERTEENVSITIRYRAYTLKLP